MINQKLFNKDLIFGIGKEKEKHNKLKDYFNLTKLKRSKNKFSIMDYNDEDNKVYIELKSRRNTKCKYPTTMIGYNKVRRGLELIKDGYNVFFIFSFTNKLCFYELTESYNKEWIIKNHTGRKDRGRREISDYFFIPITELIDIE